MRNGIVALFIAATLLASSAFAAGVKNPLRPAKAAVQVIESASAEAVVR